MAWCSVRRDVEPLRADSGSSGFERAAEEVWLRIGVAE